MVGGIPLSVTLWTPNEGWEARQLQSTGEMMVYGKTGLSQMSLRLPCKEV